MKTRILVVLGLFFGTRAVFGQAPPDSSKIYKTPPVFPRFKFKGLPEDYRFEWRTPKKNSPEALSPLAQPNAFLPPDVTPFYSNMPVAKIKRKLDPMPSAEADDASVHYHLLKKRYKVMPIPAEEEGVIK